MGSASSKYSRADTYPNRPHPRQSSQSLEKTLSGLTIDVEEEDGDMSPGLSIGVTSKWEDKLLADPKNRLALNALTANNPDAILQNPSALLEDGHIFSDKIEFEGAPITNQRSSGRCWLFASTNVFRVALMKKYKLKEFELSQAYVFFWDKLEKANYFLEQIIDTLNEPLDGRLVQELLSSPVGDGGQWDMVVNIVEKYGLVPQTLYPDSFNAKSSSRINWLVTAKLREAALSLRSLADASTSDKSSDLYKYKSKVMQEIYGALVLAFGAPPKPEDTFTWSYTDKDGKYQSLSTTPLDFYKSNIGVASEKGGVSERFSLVNDPRNEYMRLLTVDRLLNVAGGRGVRYVNVDMTTMKNAIIAMIKDQRPVFFGCDVGKFSDRTAGIMDTELFDYELGFNISLKASKAQRLSTHESAMTHAMVLSGVHIVDGKPVKWRVENSWGEAVGEKGYFVMTDRWMDEYCYQAVVDPSFVSKEVLAVLKQDPVVLPLWDPMGALA